VRGLLQQQTSIANAYQSAARKLRFNAPRWEKRFKRSDVDNKTNHGVIMLNLHLLHPSDAELVLKFADNDLCDVRGNCRKVN
jgi:hypothetical protein